MGVSKVSFAARVLIDLTSDTVAAGNLRKGETAHDASGNAITGEMEQETLFLSGDVFAFPDAMASVSDDGYLSVSDGHGSVTADGYVELIQ